jgi:hypothetical protein
MSSEKLTEEFGFSTGDGREITYLERMVDGSGTWPMISIQHLVSI